MNEATRSRVVIWLDPAADQEGALQLLAGAGFAQEILGLFIEDLDLLELSRLPMAREVTFEGAAPRALELGDLERQFRTHGGRMQKLFETAARRSGVRHAFRIARGDAGAELVRISTDCDMLVVTHSRRALAPRLTLRARLGQLLEHGPPALLLVQEQWRTGQCIATLFDNTASSKAALRTAAALARADSLPLSVWLPAANANAGDHPLVARVREILGDDRHCTFRNLEDHDSRTLARAADSENVRALVLPAGDPDSTRLLVSELLDRVNCSVIIVR